jgi:DNA-binding CsgD family transcriptional regulator
MSLREEELRRVEDVFAAAHAADSLVDFLAVTLAGLDERLGFCESAFMLALTGEGRSYAGVKHGSPPYVMEEYFERWADVDALASPAGMSAYAQRGWATVSDVYAMLEPSRRRFVDDFLRRSRATGQLSLPVPAGASVGYLTVMRAEDFDEHDRHMLAALVPSLACALRERLPHGIEAPTLSTREAQVAELLALGFTNREIAHVLHIEEDTVKKHVSHALRRLGMTHRTELAVAWATGRRLDVPSGPLTRA